MQGAESQFMSQVLSLAQLAVVAAAVGWIAEWILNTGVTTRGLPLLAGLFGIYLSSEFSFLHLVDGPTLAGQALVPAFMGAFAVCTFLKLATLGFAGPRW
jgi:uncharacterized membrane protein YeaQ/YmgE (transglycosylase-associated protein family)